LAFFDPESAMPHDPRRATVAGIAPPDTPLAHEAWLAACHDQPEWLLHHALRAYLFAALTGAREGLVCDAQLLYVCALFHNVGLAARYRRSALRFEVDGANEARAFLRQHAIAEADAALAWMAIALHTTPGIPEHMPPLVALLHAGVQMDLCGARFEAFSAAHRDEVVSRYPRGPRFKQRIIEAYAEGMRERPHTTFGTVSADVLDRIDPNHRRLNFCGLVLGSDWPS
jgi:hypothetical protein